MRLKTLGVVVVAALALFTVFYWVTDPQDRKSTRLNSSHSQISYAVFCLTKKKTRHFRVGRPCPPTLRRPEATRPVEIGPPPREPPAPRGPVRLLHFAQALFEGPDRLAGV